MTNENKNLNDELTSTKNKLEDIELKYNQLENELKNKSENVIKSLNDKIKEQETLINNLKEKADKETDNNNNNDGQIKNLEKENKDMENKIKELQNEINDLTQKNKSLTQEKERISQEKNSFNIMQSNFIMESNNNNIEKKKSNIKESNVFDVNGPLKAGNNLKESNNPFDNIGFGGMSIKESLPFFGRFPAKKENEELDINKESLKEDNANNLEFELGGEYVEDDNDNENYDMPPQEIISSSNSKKSRIKKSSALSESINNNMGFGFNTQNAELNDLYKKRDDMEDIVPIKEEEEIKKSMINNENLQKIIEQQKKEIEGFKKSESEL